MVEQSDSDRASGSGMTSRSSASMVATSDGWLRTLTPQLASILVRTSDQLTSLNWFDRVHPDDVVRARAEQASSIASGTTRRMELQMWLADESWQRVVVGLRPASDGEIVIELEVDSIDVSSHASVTEPLPGPEVAERRASIRNDARVGQNPMIEIDSSGRTVFQSGDWAPYETDSSSDSDADLVDRFLDSEGVREELGPALEAVFVDGRSTSIELQGSSKGHLRVEPIPSPHDSGVTHALLFVGAPGQAAGVSSEPAPMSLSLPRIQPDAVPVERPEHRSLRERVGRIRIWLDRRGITTSQAMAVLGVLLLGLVLRAVDLGNLPTGFHGDEAITGQEAQRVLDEGSIGIYTGSALGQPTLPFYVHAIAIGLFGPTVWATRIVSALAGVLAVGAIYLVIQKRFDHRVGLAASAAFATMTWSIHFGRIAFGLAWWPLLIVVAIALIDRAATTSDPRDWVIAGGVSALGVYVYNSHWSFGFSVAAFMALWLLARRRTSTERIRAAVYGPLGAIVVLIPMVLFMLGDNGYFNHFDVINRRSGTEWTDAGPLDKFQTAIGWYLESWNTLLFDARPDGVDASGVVDQVPLVFVVFAVVGVIVVLRRHRSVFVGLLLVCIAVMPIAPSMTIDALTRRNYALAPLLAILAGIGAIAAADMITARAGPSATRVGAGALALTVLFTSVVPYFTTFRDAGSQQWVFAKELTTSIDAIKVAEQDEPVYVNWYSARHYYNYSTLEFLLDGTPGIDRTPLDQGFIEQPSLELDPTTDRDQVFVLVGDYARQIDALQQLYPTGRIIADQPDPRMITFEVPRG